MVVVVGNSPTPIRDFSKEVAEARLVVRVNKMDNYQTGLTGTRIDWYAMVPCAHCYNVIKSKGILPLVETCQKVWFRSLNAASPLSIRHTINALPNAEVMPTKYYSHHFLYFTDNRITNLCLEMFPDEQVHLLGVDTGMELRKARKQPIPRTDVEWREKMVESGRLLIN